MASGPRWEASTRAMRRYWDARARENAMWFIHTELSYESPDEAEFWRSGEQILEEALGNFGLRFKGTERVLDLGCGIGRVTQALASRAACVVGVDVSREMIEKGCRALAGLPNVELVVGSGQDLRNWDDGSFDVVYSFIVFQHLPAPAITCRYITEIGRVLRPGGWTLFQVSEEPELHRADRWASARTTRARVKRWLRRAPRGVLEPQWLGSALARADLLAALSAGGLVLDRTVGDGTQFCQVLARKPAGR